jgi:uncharacterized membrane protein YqaE (UPF0057 family)
MRYVLAVLLPPAAVWVCNRPGRLPVSVLLTACLWVPGAVHAVFVVRDALARERTDRVADAVLAYEEQLLRARQGPARARSRLSA